MANVSIDQAKVGDVIEAIQSVDKYRPIYYAGASGDFNPIHIDPEFGKMVGLGGAILQGLCTMGFAAKMLGRWAGDPAKIKKLRVRFKKPVKPNDDLTFKAVVTARDESSITVEVEGINQDGEVVLGNAVAVIAL
ncbi:MAG: MaoC family dehydratase [Candidatus Alcyoniella australis]|nr:MaoC family dehydratase [Candidatus Alcyoniella australis]